MAEANQIPFAPESENKYGLRDYIRISVVSALVIALLWVTMNLIAAQEWLFSSIILLFAVLTAYTFLSPKAYAWRYVFPAIAGISIFVVFPILYTLGLSFTNYSTVNLLSFDQAKKYLLGLTYEVEGSPDYGFNLHQEGQDFKISLQDPQSGEKYISEDFQMRPEGTVLVMSKTNDLPVKKLPISAIIENRPSLDLIRLDLPNGMKLVKDGLRTFSAKYPQYLETVEGTLVDQQTETTYTPDFDTGFYTSEQGKQLTPGFTVSYGFKNYIRILTSKGMFEPFGQIFTWTIIFSTLSVLLTLVVGMLLATVVQWEPIKGKGVFQTLLILPYAIPAFISILVFKGLFNPNFGEINKILQFLIEASPQWFNDPFAAKSMILMVNTWLGYPYMFILCLGLLQSIPRDLYEASALDGAGPITNFFKITLPLLITPLLPLLIASFAFNFNNFVVIQLLTEGGPVILGSNPEAGHTDLLVNYAYGLAFTGDRRDFALASAVSTFIFFMVGLIALAYLKFAKVEIKR